MAASPEAVQRNIRTAVKAAIKRGTRRARADLRRLDARVLSDLEGIYRTAADDLRAAVARYGDDRQTLRLQVLQDLLGQVDGRLGELTRARDALLTDGIEAGAELGVRPFAPAAAEVGIPLTRAADDAVRFVRTFVAEDGLQLSDRLWRIDRGAREAVAGAIEQAVIQGHSASQAAQDFLARGQPVPPDVAAKMDTAQVGRVQRETARALMTEEMSPYEQARRVFRTEINRAHGEAYQAAAFEHPDVIGTRFLLSPRHPRTDICDMHATVNRYGLGPGVYPKGRNPWPAHPNTLSFVEVVFEDEVTEEDRQGKEGRIEWLKQQPGDVQAAVVGGVRKREALARDALRENEINTPWKALKPRLERRGLDPDRWNVPEPPAPPPPRARVPTDNDQAAAWAPAFEGAPADVLDVVNRFPSPGVIPPEPGLMAYHLGGAIMMGRRNAPDSPLGRAVWRHEYGHYIDHRLADRAAGQRYASESPESVSALTADATLWDARRRDAYERMRRSSPSLRQRFTGRGFDEDAYYEARIATHLATSMRLEASARAGLPRSASATEVIERTQDLALAELQAADDIYHRVLLTHTEDARRRLAVSFARAREHDDLADLPARVGELHPSRANIMDLTGSITLNRVGMGHAMSYYQRGVGNQTVEAFANAFDLLIYGPGGLEAELLDLFAPDYARFARELLDL